MSSDVYLKKPVFLNVRASLSAIRAKSTDTILPFPEEAVSF
jgi:hypothetical protein